MGQPLARMGRNASIEEITSIVKRDGAAIVEGLIDRDRVDRTFGELAPYVEATPAGKDEFSGKHTSRTGALVARSPATRELIMHPSILGSARAFLAPFCERIQLHLSQVIRICPGEEAQTIHRDRWAWGTHLAHVEPQFNTIWALTEFTRENGATRVVPGSISWPDTRQPTEEEIEYAEMDAGSVLVYSGGVFHGGGTNRVEEDRIGINLTYTLGWLRQEENQYLACPPEIARDLDPELQDLIGYTQGGYALGYYTPPLPPGDGPELVSPEFAVGRGTENSSLGAAALLASLEADVRNSKN